MTDELPAVEPSPSRDGAAPGGHGHLPVHRHRGLDAPAAGLARYADVLEDHRGPRAAFAAYGGHEVDTQGDSFFAAFPTAEQAVAAAADAQRALAAQSGRGSRCACGWACTPARRPSRGDGYVGMAVHRAARIGAAAARRPGARLRRHRRPGRRRPAGRHSLRDLGEHRLKDFPQPPRLFQLDIEGLPADFPPPRASRRRPSCPPRRRAARARDATSPRSRLLTRPRTRLVTLIGPGGIGKTRLAVETAPTSLEADLSGRRGLRAARGGRRPVARARPRGRRPRRPPGAGRRAARASCRPALGDERRCSCWTTSSRWWPRAGRRGTPRGGARRRGAGDQPQAMRLRAERQYPLAPLAETAASSSSPSAPPRSPPASPWTTQRGHGGGDLPPARRPAPGHRLAAARVRLLPPAALLGRLGERLDVLGGGPVDLPNASAPCARPWTGASTCSARTSRPLFVRLGVFAGGWSLAPRRRSAAVRASPTSSTPCPP